MKYVISLIVLVLPCFAGAQDFQNMSPEEREAMMAKVQETQACLQAIDQSDLDALQSRIESMAGEVKGLCKAGKRSEAQSTAIEYGKDMIADPTLNAMRECVAKMGQTIPQAAWAELEDSEDAPHQVCDS